MKKRLIIKTLAILTIFLLAGLSFCPVTSSNKIQSNYTITNPSETDNTNTLTPEEEQLVLLENLISKELPLYQTSQITIDDIINFIRNLIDEQPGLARKNIVISQGWSYDVNFFKNTRFQIKRDLFSFWHYTQSSKSGIESKTFVLRPNDLISSRSAELYRGNQMGFMIRPIGVYYFQKNTVPMLSYTLFIGFASYVSVTAEEVIELNPPLI